MVELLDEDDPTKYATILKFDGEMRAMGVEKVPKCLSPRTPYNPSWPKWVMWARKMHQASVNHKLIMLHQSFLSKSFKGVRYTYSRWACTSSSKNIINLYTTRDPEEPQWWVEQAFVVTSGICLVLDLFHRAESDPETQEYQAYVQKAIRFLQQFITSSVAMHGVRLLMSLLQEYDKLKEGSGSRAVPSLATPAIATRSCTCGAGNIADLPIPDAACTSHQLPPDLEMPLPFDDGTMFNFDIDALGFEDLMDYLPTEGSLNNNVVFDSVLSANGWPTW
jgi:transcription elongation factor SPT5